ncbi:MAG: protein kinase [Deltaproteobacteria bacterium]|nr:protein kinase [Deltaproteobacteria bacterium]
MSSEPPFPPSRPAWSLPGHAPPGAEPAPAPETDGERFEPRAELGSGGMGRVRLARDRWLGRLIAVKEPVTERDARRLWREALITARLEHPGVVPIYDLGLGQDGVPWYAMRVVRGRSLAEILRDASALEERLRLLRPLLAACEAIGYAHDQGVVHRDLKPANLMIGAFGEMQVIDWGLAASADVPDADFGSAGTLGYMAPEQARGEPVDARSDVWSLGAVLFEIVTGTAIRSHVADDQLLAAARTGERRPLPDGASPELAAIIQRATAFEPAHRYRDAKALADDLARYLDGRRVEAHRYSTRELLRRLLRAWRVPLVVLAASLAVLATLVVIGVVRIAEERDGARANLALSRVREAQQALRDERHGDAERLGSLALATPDALVLAEARGVLAAVGRGHPERDELFTPPCAPADVAPGRALCRDKRTLTSWHEGRRRFGRELASRAALFIDGGRAIAVLGDQSIEVIDADDGATRQTFPIPCPTAFGMRFEPTADRRSALTWHNHCAAVVGAGGVTPLPDHPCAPGNLSVLAASPDLSRFAGACNDGALVLIGPGRSPQRLAAGFGSDRDPPMLTALSFVSPEVLIAGAADGTLEEVTLQPHLARRHLPAQHGMVRHITVAPLAGVALVFADASAPLVIHLERRTTLVRLPSQGRIDVSAIDDQGRLLMATRRGDGGMVERWQLGGLLPRRLPFPDGVTAVAASADGRWLAVGDGAELALVDHTRRVVATREWQGSIIKTLGFDQRGRLVAHALGEMSVRAFAPTAADALSALPNLRAPASIWRRVALLADGSAVATNYRNEQYRLHHDRDFELIGRERLVDLVASGDGRDLATLDEAGVVRCARDFANTRSLGVCARVDEGRALALDEHAVIVVAPQAVRRFARPIGSVPGEPGEETVHLAPDADLTSVALRDPFIAAGSRDGAVWLWRGTATEPLAIVRDHDQRVDSLAFSGDGLVAGGWDGAISFIDPSELVDRGARLPGIWGLPAE